MTLSFLITHYRLATSCAVVDVSASNVSLAEAQAAARASTALCTKIVLGQRRFRLKRPFVLIKADSNTRWVGGEFTTAIDVPAGAWRQAQQSNDPTVGLYSTNVSRLVDRSEWGAVSGSASSVLPDAHLTLLVKTRGTWRPMTLARWPNVPFYYADVPPVNWTTIDTACPCPGAPQGGCDATHHPRECGIGCKSFTWANTTDRPARWVKAANEGRLFIHGFFKYMWKDHFATITSIDVGSRRMISNTSIGGSYGLTNDSYYYAYGMHEELDSEGEYLLNTSSGTMSAIFPDDCLRHGEVVCPTRLVPATSMTRTGCCVTSNCTLGAIVRVVGAQNISFLGTNITGSTGVGISVWGSTNVTLDSCRLDNHQVLRGYSCMYVSLPYEYAPIQVLASSYIPLDSHLFTHPSPCSVTTSHTPLHRAVLLALFRNQRLRAPYHADRSPRRPRKHGHPLRWHRAPICGYPGGAAPALRHRVHRHGRGIHHRRQPHRPH